MILNSSVVQCSIILVVSFICLLFSYLINRKKTPKNEISKNVDFVSSEIVQKLDELQIIKENYNNPYDLIIKELSTFNFDEYCSYLERLSKKDLEKLKEELEFRKISKGQDAISYYLKK